MQPIDNQQRIFLQNSFSIGPVNLPSWKSVAFAVGGVAILTLGVYVTSISTCAIILGTATLGYWLLKKKPIQQKTTPKRAPIQAATPIEPSVPIQINSDYLRIACNSVKGRSISSEDLHKYVTKIKEFHAKEKQRPLYHNNELVLNWHAEREIFKDDDPLAFIGDEGAQKSKLKMTLCYLLMTEEITAFYFDNSDSFLGDIRVFFTKDAADHHEKTKISGYTSHVWMTKEKLLAYDAKGKALKTFQPSSEFTENEKGIFQEILEKLEKENQDRFFKQCEASAIEITSCGYYNHQSAAKVLDYFVKKKIIYAWNWRAGMFNPDTYYAKIDANDKNPIYATWQFKTWRKLEVLNGS